MLTGGEDILQGRRGEKADDSQNKMKIPHIKLCRIFIMCFYLHDQAYGNPTFSIDTDRTGYSLGNNLIERLGSYNTCWNIHRFPYMDFLKTNGVSMGCCKSYTHSSLKASMHFGA